MKCPPSRPGVHKQVMVQVNAPVDEGIADLVSALSGIDGVETLESCQGDAGERAAFVVFRFGDWRRCGDLLFDRLLPSMHPDLRSGVSVRLEAYDTESARAWIELDPGAVGQMSDCVRRLAASIHP